MKITKAKKQKQNRAFQRGNGNGSYSLTDGSVYTGFDKPNITFIDPHRYVALRYIDNLQNILLTLTGGQQIFNLNSIWDPDRTGTGHQPYGFDQLAAIYNRYRVLKTHWRITFSPAGLTYDTVIVPVNGALSSAISSTSTWNTAAENPRAFSFAQSGTGQTKVVQGKISLNNLNGCTTLEYLGDDRFEATTGGSPTELMSLYVGFYNPNASTVTINWTAELIYYVDFHDIISQGGS